MSSDGTAIDTSAAGNTHIPEASAPPLQPPRDIAALKRYASSKDWLLIWEDTRGHTAKGTDTWVSKLFVDGQHVQQGLGSSIVHARSIAAKNYLDSFAASDM